MNYEYLWKVLEELIVEFTKKGFTIPRELVDNLKSAKTLISIYNVEPTSLDVATEIELYLENVESNLLYLAESDIGKEYADECLRRVYEARGKGLSDKVMTPSRFVSGVPKGEHWIRIKASGLINDRVVGKLLEKHSLSSKPQENGYLLVHGKEEDVKAFIKEVSEKLGKRRDIK